MPIRMKRIYEENTVDEKSHVPVLKRFLEMSLGETLKD